MAWARGEKITDQVRLIRPLSSDKVWLADQLFWHKQVVVKVVPTELGPEEQDARLALAEEAAQARTVQHQHVAPTLAFGLTYDATPFVLLEPLEGQTLRATLKEGGPFDPRTARNVVRQIAEALDSAHAQGLFHGALNPDNVWWCSHLPAPHIKVLNLGFAAVLPRVHTDYVSPEFYLGKPIDARTDIWSLGVIAFELLSRERPFDQNNRLMLSWHFVPLSARTDEPVPEDIDGFFERVFSVVPGDRFDSIRAMAEAFSAAVLSRRTRPSLVDGVRPSRISRHHVLDVGPRKDDEQKGEPE